MFDLLIKLVTWMMRRCDYMLVVRRRGKGFLAVNTDEDGRKHLSAITVCAIKNGYEDAKDYVLDTAADYLQPLAIESREFAERIK